MYGELILIHKSCKKITQSLECKPHFSWCMRRIPKLWDIAQPRISAENASTVRSIWVEIRVVASHVAWYKLVWFSLHIPKHAFIAWLAVLNRLLIRDRLSRIKIEGSNQLGW